MRRFLLLITFSVALMGCEGSTGANAVNEGQLSIEQRLEQKCLSEFPALIVQSDALIEQGKAEEAAQVLQLCKNPLLGKSAEYVLALDRVRAAQLEQRVQGIPTKQWQDRLHVLEEWDGLVEKLPPPFDKELSALQKRQHEVEARRLRYSKQAEAMKYYPFCSEVGRLVRARGPLGERGKAFVEVARSKYGVRDEDELPIRERGLQIGMPFCAVVASLGTPSEVREIASASGTVWSVWYRDREVLIWLNEKQEVATYSR